MNNEKRMIAIIIVTIIFITIGYETLASTPSTPSYNTEQDCRTCHGNDTANRHHLLAVNNTYNCLNCHPVQWDTSNQSFSVQVTRNCLVCHVGKNHTQVHHIQFAAQGLYGCTDCHRVLFDNTTGQYYTELIHDCPVCHSTTTGKVTFPWNITPTPTPIPTPIPTPNPAPNAPTGLHNPIECSTCHTTPITEETCYQCHNNSNNSYHGINITYQFTIRNDSFSGMGKDYYNNSNTRHDITDADQYNSSTRLECTDCHSAHKADRNNVTIDPDTRAPFNKTMTHPGTGETVMDSVTFCIKCHDNTWPSPNVIGPSVIMNISKSYLELTSKGDEHGAASGKNNSRLIGPYNGTPSSNVPPMPCSDCHDPHGGKGIYHLKTLTDQYGKNITITSNNINNHTVAHWCSNCHYNPMNQLDGTRDNCLRSGCHIHGKKF